MGLADTFMAIKLLYIKACKSIWMFTITMFIVGPLCPGQPSDDQIVLSTSVAKNGKSPSIFSLTTLVKLPGHDDLY